MQPISLLYFLPALTVAKAKMYWHHEKQYEGYGRMWPLVRNCAILILLVYQLTICGLLGLKGGYYPSWVTGVATIPLTLLLGKRMGARYAPSMLGAVPVEVHAERERRARRGHSEPGPGRSALMLAAASPTAGVPHSASVPVMSAANGAPVPRIAPRAPQQPLAYLHPALAAVDVALANDTELLARFGQGGLRGAVAGTVELAGKGAGSLVRAANRLLKRAPLRAKPLVMYFLSWVVDPVDLHSSLDEEEEDESPASVPRSIQQLRANTASKLLAQTVPPSREEPPRELEDVRADVTHGV